MDSQLNFPEFDIRTRIRKNQTELFDVVREAWIQYTPEEWVRQHTIRYLIEYREVPGSLIAVEMPIKVNNMNRRCDIVVYDNSGQPKMIVECKSPAVKISQSTVEQAARYNLTLKAPFLMLTNGMKHFAFYVNFGKFSTEILKEIPNYSLLTA